MTIASTCYILMMNKAKGEIPQHKCHQSIFCEAAAI